MRSLRMFATASDRAIRVRRYNESSPRCSRPWAARKQVALFVATETARIPLP